MERIYRKQVVMEDSREVAYGVTFNPITKHSTVIRYPYIGDNVAVNFSYEGGWTVFNHGPSLQKGVVTANQANQHYIALPIISLKATINKDDGTTVLTLRDYRKSTGFDYTFSYDLEIIELVREIWRGENILKAVDELVDRAILQLQNAG